MPPKAKALVSHPVPWDEVSGGIEQANFKEWVGKWEQHTPSEKSAKLAELEADLAAKEEKAETDEKAARKVQKLKAQCEWLRANADAPAKVKPEKPKAAESNRSAPKGKGGKGASKNKKPKAAPKPVPWESLTDSIMAADLDEWVKKWDKKSNDEKRKKLLEIETEISKGEAKLASMAQDVRYSARCTDHPRASRALDHALRSACVD